MNELSASVSLRYSKDGDSVNVESKAWSATVTGTNRSEGTLDLVASYEFIPLGDVSIGGVCFFENLGTDTICIREDLTGTPRFTLKPGETAGPIRLDATGFATPAAKAAASTSRLKYLIIED